MINLNLRHSISSRQDTGVDIDWLNYAISGEQYFNNRFRAPGGYNESSRGIYPPPSKFFRARLITACASARTTVSGGMKSSHISTDNTASYENFDGLNWTPDYNKNNHFLYKENIHACTASIETRRKKYPALQLGLGTSSRVTMPTNLATCSKRFNLLA